MNGNTIVILTAFICLTILGIVAMLTGNAGIM
ncbi:hypothetical protein LABALGNA3A7_09640 [Dellaglioa algida]|nr:hypothetical protein LABALGNA3A7_09640 [Dellaglioa algida]